MAKKESFITQKKELKLNTPKKTIEFLIGKEVEVLGNGESHNYGAIGTRFIVSEEAYLGGTASTRMNINLAIPDGNSISFRNFRVVSFSNTKEDIENRIKTIQSRYKELDLEIETEKLKLKYLEETGSEEYNENEFKVYTTLNTLENTSISKMDKVKAIAKLING